MGYDRLCSVLACTVNVVTKRKVCRPSMLVNEDQGWVRIPSHLLKFIMTLNDLPIGQIAVIVNHNMQRLVAMGIQPGKCITVIRRSPGNAVLHCRIETFEFAIRRSLAQSIFLAT